MSKQTIQIIDSTLRDGEQAPGVNFSREEKLILVKLFSKAGIPWIEAGIPAMGPYERETLRQMAALGLSARLSTWNRMLRKDVDAALETGIKDIHLSISVSDIQIENKLRKSRAWVLSQTADVVSYAKDKGLWVSVGGEDASRAQGEFLDQFLALLARLKVERFRFADTVGALEPFSTQRIIQRLHSVHPSIRIDFHGHNDFGLATANALAAAHAGAEFLSCTVNSLGERAGNAALEEVVVALEFLYALESGIHKEELSLLSKKVARYARRSISAGKPIVGSKVFTHESGIHVDGLIKAFKNYEFLSPGALGRKHQFVLGKYSGSAAIKEALKAQGVAPTAKRCRTAKDLLAKSMGRGMNL